jgi:hypothetical protein
MRAFILIQKLILVMLVALDAKLVRKTRFVLHAK